MSKQPKTVRAIGAKPSQEELEEEAKRAFYQKRNALAEIILSNAVHAGAGINLEKPDFKPAVDAALEAADYFMEKAYSVSIKVKETEE